MPEGVKDPEKLVKDLVEIQDHWLQALAPRFREMVGDHKLYLGHREDRRQAHEKWRSWSWLGDPYSLTTTETDAWLEILGGEPPACEGVGTEDEWKARGVERMSDYILRGNKWPYVLEMLARNLSIQGWKVIKTGWREIKFSPMRRPTKDELVSFDSAVNEALKTGNITSPPDPTSQPEEFQGWMDSTKQVFPGFPDAPGIQQGDTVSYRGPWLYRPSEFELRFDPYVEDWTEHEIFFQRVVKPRKWGEDQVKAGKFDSAAFKRASRSGPEDTRLSQYDRQIAQQIGLTMDDQDPIYKDSDEYWEVWRPYNQEAPYLVILNRTEIVNTSTANPFWHRQLPYVCVKNIPLERRAFGLGSYSQLRRTFQDRLTFRDLMLDGLLLSVMPIFLKNRNMGMTEMQRSLTPGMILDVNDVNNSFKRGWESMAGFSELMQVGAMFLGDQTTLTATGENVKGQPAQVGRVSATESQARLTQALGRHKKKAERLEVELSAILPQCLYNAYQFLPEDDPTLMAIRAAMVGEDEVDPLKAPEFTRETFAETFALNMKFRGATTKLNKELMAQQLQGLLATASQIQSAAGMPVQIMTPEEARNLLRRVYETMANKGAEQVFTPAGDAAVAAASQAHTIAAQTAPVAAQTQNVQTQAALQAAQNPPAAPEAPPQPTPYKDTPPDIQRQMEQKAGFQPSQLGSVTPQPKTPPANNQPPEGFPQ